MFGKREKALPLTAEQIEQLQTQIEQAEILSSAEFKIILIRSSWIGIHYKARKLFKKYGMQNTERQNAVLILVDYTNKNMVLYGGDAVYRKMGKQFWNELRDMLEDALKGGPLFDALTSCVNILAHRLPIYYPYNADVVNELSNELIFE